MTRARKAERSLAEGVKHFNQACAFMQSVDPEEWHELCQLLFAMGCRLAVFRKKHGLTRRHEGTKGKGNAPTRSGARRARSARPTFTAWRLDHLRD